ncbi:MAG TPA: xanthine dehydrogenase accessory protein XdhC [Rhabdaerophilum sp.]|nr:xanthine dehydrogenase accessory protein XdhC [Rhabdaerophilum sp.]
MIWHHIANWLSAGSSCCLVAIREARGSTPREAGARLAIGADGRFTGTIGGGTLEWEAMAIARELIARYPEGHGTAHSFALGPALGQCCGGSVVLRFEAFSPGDLRWIEALSQAEAAGAFDTVGEPDRRGILIRTVAQSGAQPSLERESHGEAKRDVLLFGAGHIGRALVLALAPLPFRVRWIDSREDPFPTVFPQNVRIDTSGDSIFVAGNEIGGEIAVVATHSHQIDFDIVARLLRNDAFHFIGLIGSETKRKRFLSRLKELGYALSTLERLTCPIGLSGIHGKEPAVIAASVAAQLLMLPRKVNAPA